MEQPIKKNKFSYFARSRLRLRPQGIWERDYRSRFQENDDLPLWRGPAVKKKPPFSNARALITRKVMRSRDAQCNTGE